MKREFLISRAALAMAAGMVITLSETAAAQTPKMGGGYKDVIAIPVDDPATKAIAGALFKPAGAGPLPAVIYMSTCDGINRGEDHLVSRHRDCDGLAYRRMGSVSGGMRSWMLRATPGAREMRPAFSRVSTIW